MTIQINGIKQSKINKKQKTYENTVNDFLSTVVILFSPLYSSDLSGLIRKNTMQVNKLENTIIMTEHASI